MNRFGISTAQLLRRRAPTQRPPAVDTYRHRPGHLADAGGAYLVLPYGLLHTLNGDRQQRLVDILTELAAIDPRWAATTTYQVLPWTRIRPGDLSDEELTWHGITSDIDPSTGAVAYSRGGAPVNPDTIIGHRPAPDTIPAPAGTYPGARPALLPAGPGPETVALLAISKGRGLRTERAQRMIESHRRRQLLAQHAPAADVQWAEAVIAADPLWGPEQDWKLLIDQTTRQVPILAPLPADDPHVEESDEPASPGASHHTGDRR
jgi:hypothetical protein